MLEDSYGQDRRRYVGAMNREPQYQQNISTDDIDIVDYQSSIRGGLSISNIISTEMV